MNTYSMMQLPLLQIDHELDSSRCRSINIQFRGLYFWRGWPTIQHTCEEQILILCACACGWGWTEHLFSNWCTTRCSSASLEDRYTRGATSSSWTLLTIRITRSLPEVWKMKTFLIIPRVLLVAIIFLLVSTEAAQAAKTQYQWDEYGYVLYCPCMGEYLSYGYEY